MNGSFKKAKNTDISKKVEPNKCFIDCHAVSNRRSAIDAIRGRSWFYHLRNSGQQKALAMMGSALLISLAMNGWAITREPAIKIIATDEMGRVLPLHTLDEPVLDRAQVTNLAASCLMRSLTFNYRHYRQELDQASHCYTTKGWEAFITEISREGGVLKKVVSGNMIATANLREAAILTDQGMLNGRYAWMIQVPLVLTVEKEGAGGTDVWLAEVRVVRVPQTENIDGAAVDSVVIQRSAGR
jgi:intracellular multiplication protein IcmL